MLVMMMIENMIDEIMVDAVSEPVCLEDHLLLSPIVPKGLELPPMHADDKGMMFRCVVGEGWQVICHDCERVSCWLGSYALAEVWAHWHTFLVERPKSVHANPDSV